MLVAFPIVAALVLTSVQDGPAIETELQWRPPDSARIVVAGDAVAARLGQVTGATVVSAADLPRPPLAYERSVVLAIGRDALSRLDDLQLRAVLEHVGLCGRVLLIDPPAEVERLMRQRAACGGRYLLDAASGESATQALRTLARQGANPLPDAITLGRLLIGRSADIRLIALYLGGFLLIFATLLTVPRSRGGVALTFSLLATALAGALWGGGSRQAFVAWAEVAGTERIARYASLERASAMGRGTEVLHLQSLARSPLKIMGEGLILNWSETARDRYLDWSASLLQEMQVFSMGSFPVENRLRAGTQGETVTVCNQGNRQTPAAYLNWRGANYDVPGLAPGERWTADESTATAESAPHLQLLARRASREAVTLLQPLQVPGNGGSQRAWLMRVEANEPGAKPCRG